jgi:nucleoside-diphosphate-sugar epimerase
MKVFLTGATGFIGQALVRAMRRRSWDVRALVRNVDGAPARWLTEKGVQLVPGDVTQTEGLRQAMSGSDVVLHNAGVYEFGTDAALRARMEAVNVEGTAHVLGAALEARVPRTVYVSTVWALGPSGISPAPAEVKDETQLPSGAYLTPYERTKAEAHQVALALRARGLPLVIGMPNAVSGANDHSLFGYLLRLYLLHALPPMAWSANTVYSFVDVEALAEGLCLSAERAPLGGDYLFCGDPITVRGLLELWDRYPGGMRHRLWLPRWLMRFQMLFLEPVQRALGLPPFLSREAVAASSAHLNFSAAKARRELGWSHPAPEAMWDRIVRREQELARLRKGFRDRLRPLPVIPD